MSMRTVCGYPVFEPGHEATEEHGTGYEGRDYEKYPLNGQEHNRPSDIVPLSDADLRKKIKEKDDAKSWLKDMADRAGLPPKNQKSSSYCWIHAPTHGMELELVASGAPPKILSAFYAAYQIKHGSNSGGSGVQGMKTLADGGTCEESMCAPMTFHVHETPEMKANAELHRAQFICEIEPNDHATIRTALVQNKAVTVGIPAAGHEMILVGLLIDEHGNIWYMARNSWGAEWGGRDGYCLLGDKYSIFDEAMYIAGITQSAA